MVGRGLIDQSLPHRMAMEAHAHMDVPEAEASKLQSALVTSVSATLHAQDMVTMDPRTEAPELSLTEEGEF